ncbi:MULTISPECIES: hypothetical protein [Streptomyces]|uniref:hypothetical protein n=1 Tax=Streptomyces TaxID=1883 RepID=UPI0004CD2CC0|nr:MULTISPECIES: hypothetical protein [Streptomyces]KOT64451.1 hypothetical protein ADK43_05860 [Streptomyces rimosus subsp. rimosus]
MTGKPKKKHAPLRLRSTAAASTTLLLALSTTGCAAGEERCGPAPATRYGAADLYGEWSSHRGTSLDLKNLGGKLGRTFLTHAWPKDTTAEQATAEPPPSGIIADGNWDVSPDRTTLTLTFDRIDADLARSTVRTLRIGEEKGHPVLYQRLGGGPDVCHVLELKRQGD